MPKISPLAIAMMLLFAQSAVIVALDPPSLLSPISGVNISDNTPRFEWVAMGGADNYELQYSTDGAFPAGNTATRDNVRQTFFEPENALPDGTYYWRMRSGKNSGEVSAWSSTQQFVLDTVPPPEPSQLYPQDNVLLKTTPAWILWSSLSGVVYYRLVLDDSADFSSPAINSIYYTTTAVPQSLPDGLYYWKVSARDYAGNETYSGVFTFTIDSLPPSVELLSPLENENTADNTPLLKWKVEDNFVENSEIYIDNKLAWVQRGSGQLENSAPEMEEGLHRWRVRVYDNAGNVKESQENSFYIDKTGPPVPTRLSPENGGRILTKSVPLSWTPVTDRGHPVSYELWVDDSQDFGSPAVQETITENGKSVELADGAYFWRVRARDNAGNFGSFGGPWSFTLDNTPPPKPSLTWPSENVMENTARPTFSWAAVTDFSKVKYELQVDEDNAFSSPAVTATLETTTFTPLENMHDGIYWWRVRAVDNFGHVGEWSDNVRFEVFLQDFSISGNFEITVTEGDFTTKILEVANIGKYSQVVNLSVGGQPSDVEISFVGNGLTPPFYPTMWVVTEQGVRVGDYTVTITGRNDNGWVRTANFTLKILRRSLAEISRLSAGENTVVQIGRDKVLQLEIKASSSAENIKVSLWSEEPLVKPEAGLVYSYFSLELQNMENKLESLKINFWVDGAWVQEQGANAKTVRLSRYFNGAWQELPTQDAGSDANRLYFSASSTGASTFAITAEKAVGPPSYLYFIPLLAILAGFVAWILYGREQGGGMPEHEERRPKPLDEF
ncbi:MAG: Ig-like domain-containing protein [Candidatus Hadarchaeota archaeon]